ncbi:MAG: MBL fold metallo-hydrolase RNA specificity domain-containing protein [Promethearchaeota archaeon]
MSRFATDFQLVGSKNIAVIAGVQRILFDPLKPPRHVSTQQSVACVSHAHSDHTAAFASSIEKYATQITLDIHQALGGQTRKSQPVKLGGKIRLSEGVDLHVHSAGHMLGAAQFEVEWNGRRLVYTGDLNLSSTLITKGAQPIPCDILLIEATYGRPDAIFPPRESVCAEIVEWTSCSLKSKKIPAFQVYAKGKAQELLRILNMYLTVPVVVDTTVAKVNEVYVRHGVPLEYTAANTVEGRELIRQGDYVYISPQRFNRRFFPAGHRFVRAKATGWAQIFPMKSVDKAFVLSAHADFQQLLRYVEEAKPEAVFLVNGETTTFYAVLEKLGVKTVKPGRGTKLQMRLSDFI